MSMKNIDATITEELVSIIAEHGGSIHFNDMDKVCMDRGIYDRINFADIMTAARLGGIPIIFTKDGVYKNLPIKH